VLAAAVLVVLTGGDDGESPARDGGGGLVEDLRSGVELHEPATSAEEAASVLKGPRYAIARVLPGEKVELRDRPEGELIESVGDETEFGSQRNFWVVRSKGEWLGVASAELPNGELAWIRDDGGELEILETRYHVTADISERELELHYGNKVLERFPVTVGGPGSPTPPGAYAVTDGLAGKGVGPYYGCCILALSGHQPNLPPDWLGGDRIAIHGTPGEVGAAASAGCLRASDMDMVSLFARVPLGAPVFIRA
jgi:hypothetical protein